MARRLFFAEPLPAATPPQAVVRGPEARHLTQVLRARPGMQMELSAGGDRFLAAVARVEAGAVIFDLLQPLAPAAAPLGPRVIAAIFKFDRFEWMLEKATELGVAEIQPLAAARTDPRLARAAAGRQERWRRILQSAAQQSRRAEIPRLRPPAVWSDLAAEPPAEPGEARLLLSEDPAASPLASRLAAPLPRLITLAIGPEGGWTEADSAAAGGLGFVPVSLGPRILRAETAALAALAYVLAVAPWP